MKQHPLCLAVSDSFGVAADLAIRLIAEAGFDAFFTQWNQSLSDYRALAAEYRLRYSAVHAPFRHAADMWQEGDAGRLARDELLSCVRDCARVEVPLLFVHPFIGFGLPDAPNDCGVAHFRSVAEEAQRLGVKIALENVEGEGYLARLMTELADLANVGFCWDSGHESCYNRGRDMLALYGDRLMGMHLNDNIGVTGKEIFYTDDLHLLPLDGRIDWENAACRLAHCNWDGDLTFELKKTHPKYESMTTEAYIHACHERAVRVAALLSAKESA